MTEVGKQHEVSEVKSQDSENYREIKPLEGMTSEAARGFFDEHFENGAEAEVEEPEVKGGSYADVKAHSDSTKYEVHHTPADSAAHLDGKDSPAVKMEIADHRRTASWGPSKEARAYCAEQEKLISQGKFREAVQMDVEDIQTKFPGKYDEAISQMLAFVDKLEQEGKI